MSGLQFSTFIDKINPIDGRDGDLIFTVDIDTVTKPNLILPVSGNVDITVYWGDGNTDTYSQTGIANTVVDFASATNPKHTYNSSGNYTVIVRGNVSYIKAITDDSEANNNPYISTLTNIGLNTKASAFDLSFDSKINQISELPDFLPSFVKKLSFENVTTMPSTITNWNTSAVQDFSHCFKNANFLGNIYNWNLYNATNTTNFFGNSTNSNVDISSWIVTDNQANGTNNLFANTTNFQGDMSNWSFNNNTILYGLTRGSTNFQGNMSNWDVSNISNVNANNWMVFDGSVNATPTLNLTFSNTTNIHNLFYGSVTANVDTSNWINFQNYITSVSLRPEANAGFLFNNARNPKISPQPNLTNMSKLYYGANLLSYPNEGNITNWDMSNVTSINGMFKNGKQIVLDLNNWANTLSSGVDMTEAFSSSNTDSFYKLDLQNWDMSGANATRMFANTVFLSCNINNMNFYSNTTVTNMFKNSSLRQFNVDNTDISNVSFISSTKMFEGTANLEFINANNMILPTSIQYMFSDLESTDSAFFNNSNIHLLNTANVTNMEGLFTNANIIGNITGLDISSVTNMDKMFQGLPTTFSGYYNDAVIPSGTSITSMFYNSNVQNVNNFDNWIFNSRSDMGQIFTGITQYSKPNLRNWNVSNVTSMADAFGNTNSFNANISSWTLGSTNCSRIFANTTNFISKSIDNWDMTNVSNLSYAIANTTNFNPDDVTTANWTLGNISIEGFGQNANFSSSSSIELANNNSLLGWIDTTQVNNMKQIWYNSTSPSTYVGYGVYPNLTTLEGAYASTKIRSGSSVKDVKVEDMTANVLTNMSDFLRGCANTRLTISNVSMPLCENISNAFANARLSTGGISNTWILGNLTDITNSFNNANANCDLHLNGWDVSTISNFSNVFANCRLSNATSISGPVGANTIHIGNWDMNNASNLHQMFYQTYSNITVPSNVTFTGNVNLYEVFLNTRGSSSSSGGLQNDLADWDFVTNNDNTVTLFTARFARYSGMSNVDYNKTLIGWANRVHAKVTGGGTVPSLNGGFDFNGSYRSNVTYTGTPYNTGYAAWDYLENTIGWNFVDSGTI